MATSYTDDQNTTMSEAEAKALYDRDFTALMDRILRLKNEIGGREGAREVSLVYTKLQEAWMWYQEAKKRS